MVKKNEDIIRCDFCNSRAIVNFQKIWVKFIIDKNGKYKRDKNFCGENFEQPMNEDNIHLCKRHLEKFLRGEF